MSAEDRDWMARALALARKSAGHTRPNPPVGAVIVRDGRILGEGRHRRCGAAHAEANAIANARGISLKGATIYVTLEPCSKSGRVGACTDAIVAAGIERVVYGCEDPNPKNRRKAKRILAKSGIKCEYLPDEGCRELIAPFAKHVTTGMPFVTVKLAMSLDGKICDDWGDARWVSSERARKTTGKLRESADVVMVGAETIRKDNPSLLCHTKRNDDLWRAVISKSGRLPKDAQVFTDVAKMRTLVYRDVKSALSDLGSRGFMHVLCEGGLALARSLAEAGMVDEWITVLASKVIGGRRIGEAVEIERTKCLQD